MAPDAGTRGHPCAQQPRLERGGRRGKAERRGEERRGEETRRVNRANLFRERSVGRNVARILIYSSYILIILKFWLPLSSTLPISQQAATAEKEKKEDEEA